MISFLLQSPVSGHMHQFFLAQIHQRWFLAFAFVLLAVGNSSKSLCAAVFPPQDSDRPNIVLIMADDLGYTIGSLTTVFGYTAETKVNLRF